MWSPDGLRLAWVRLRVPLGDNGYGPHDGNEGAPCSSCVNPSESLRKIVNHSGIHSAISSSLATCKTHDARHVAKLLLISERMPQWFTIFRSGHSSLLAARAVWAG